MRPNLLRVPLVMTLLFMTSCGDQRETFEREPGAGSQPEICSEADCIVKEAETILYGKGSSAAVKHVEGKTSSLPLGANVCHDALHRLGESAVDSYGETLGELELTACAGGFLHGLFSGFGGEFNWVERAVEICSPFKDLQALLCKHGYGHAAVAGSTSVDEAMRRCYSITTADGAVYANEVPLVELCSDGAFMEVVVKVESGEWREADPISTCNALEGWAAWGCWRQMSRVLEPGLLSEYAKACTGFDSYLGEACSVGVAEAIVEDYSGDENLCSFLPQYVDLCVERIRGRGF